MNEMIERVIDALALAEGLDDGLRVERLARAALEAMREPTKTMEKAGRTAAEYEFDVEPYEDGDNITPNERLAGYVWSAMIDAALAASPINPEEEKPANG